MAYKLILNEIQHRLVYFTFSVLCTFATCYKHSNSFVYSFTKPLILLDKEGLREFIFTTVSEAFRVNITLASIFTMVFLLPLFFYNLVVFLMPAFYQKNRKPFLHILGIGLFGFYLVIIFVFVFILPQVCQFFLYFEEHGTGTLTHISLEASIYSYTLFSLSCSYFFLFLFYCLFFAIISLYYQHIHIDFFWRNRKFLSIVILLVSSLLCPPDPIYQVLFFVCFYILYESFIFCGFLCSGSKVAVAK